MIFRILMGIPEMEKFWNDLVKANKEGTATENQKEQYKKLGKTFYDISCNPRYPGLKTHEIEELTRRYGVKVWQSYIENRKPAAGRIFWVYGPQREDITIIGIEPHPNNKNNSYRKIKLSETKKK